MRGYGKTAAGEAWIRKRLAEGDLVLQVGPEGSTWRSSSPCCPGHRPPGPGWCINGRLDGVEACCENCPDYGSWDDEEDGDGSGPDVGRNGVQHGRLGPAEQGRR